MPKPARSLSDPGGARILRARWVVTADLILESAAHFGGGQGGTTDMALLRDPVDGSALLPGSSLAGALRAQLADFLGGYRSAEDERVARLFGPGRSAKEGAQSPMIVFEARGELPPDASVEIRDGVAIDSARGTAEDHKKYDFEVLPAGTRFPLRLELVVDQAAREAELVALLATCLMSVGDGELSIGLRRSRGLGRLRAERWRARRHDLATAEGWLAWLASDHEHPIDEEETWFPTPMDALSAAGDVSSILESLPEDRRRRVVADLSLRLSAELLVRAAPAAPSAPDVVQLRSGGKPVLPGSSLAGVLRARALRIARCVLSSDECASAFVEQMFGPRLAANDNRNEATLFASRLRVREGAIRSEEPLRRSRIRIDRFTQGVVPGALFDEEPVAGGQIAVALELRDPQPGETGLLLLILKDLLAGDLAVGGASAIGRGVIQGWAEVRFADGRSLILGQDGSPSKEELAYLDRWIAEFHETQAQPAQEKTR